MFSLSLSHHRLIIIHSYHMSKLPQYSMFFPLSHSILHFLCHLTHATILIFIHIIPSWHLSCFMHVTYLLWSYLWLVLHSRSAWWWLKCVPETSTWHNEESKQTCAIRWCKWLSVTPPESQRFYNILNLLNSELIIFVKCTLELLLKTCTLQISWSTHSLTQDTEARECRVTNLFSTDRLDKGRKWSSWPRVNILFIM